MPSFNKIFVAAVLTGAGLASAAVAPKMAQNLLKRADNSSGLTDADILNFALTLEHLENTFYKQALSNYTDSDFSSASDLGGIVRPNIASIGADESSHVELLTGALSAAGATPVQACTYSFPATDAKSFLGLAQVIEGVGVSAYLGAARYIASPDYLEVAGSILTVEARHNAFLRLVNGYSPAPSPYDTGLTPKAIVSLAGSFFASCPDGSAPSIQPFPAATVSTTNYTVGSTIDVAVNSSVTSGQSMLYCAFASGVQNAFSTYSNGSCQIPSSNVTGGQVYGLITTAQNISDASTVAGPFILNIDTMNNTLSNASKGSTMAVNTSGAEKYVASTGVLALAAIVAML